MKIGKAVLKLKGHKSDVKFLMLLNFYIFFDYLGRISKYVNFVFVFFSLFYKFKMSSARLKNKKVCDDQTR